MAMDKALGEVIEVMVQYTKCADPTESAARQERLRIAEEQGELEATAIMMVQASINANLIDTVIIYQGKSFYASFIHGDCDRKQRLMQWDHMLNRAENHDAPWFVTGDFNDLLSDEEKLGGPTRLESSFVDLRTFFSEGDLFDLRHAGDPLSWRGQRGDHLVRCRLDRAVANRLWAECYPTACCQYLEYESSDRKPLSSFFEHEAKRRRGLI